MNRLVSWLLVLLAAIATGGCAHYQAKPLAADQSHARFAARTLSDPGLRAFLETNLAPPIDSWPLPTWDLTHLTFAALYFHPDLEVARAQWRVATAGQRTAGERPNPTLSVTPAYNNTTHVPSPWLVTPTLDVPIETAGKRGYRIALATHLADAARLNIATIAWQVRSRVRAALLGVVVAGETEALLKRQLALHADNLRLLEQQHAAGAISAFELTQARLGADRARLALREAERQGAEARVQLADAMGVPMEALERIQVSGAGLGEVPAELPDTAEARRLALLQRPDILAALAGYAAAESALQLELAKQYPDVHLSPGYEFDQGDNKWSLGLSITLPVLNQNQGAISEAEAKRALAATQFEALQARVVGEIDRAVVTVRGARQTLTETDALVAHVEQQERSIQAMLAAGAAAQDELVAVRLQLSTAALARLDARARAQQALGQLEDALRSPLDLSANALSALTNRVSEPAKKAKP